MYKPMRKYYTKSIRQQNFLEENGVEPKFFLGETAVYKYNKQLQLLLDRYEIKYSICKTRY